MFEEIPDQIEYLNGRYQELCALAQAEVNEIEVSTGIRNVTQDILTRSSKLLDSIVFEYIESRLLPKMPTDAKFRDTQVYFPILTAGDDSAKMFERCGIADIKTLDSTFQSVLESYQPDNGHPWIQHLRGLANLSHRRLVRQKKHTQPTVNLGGVIQISGNGVKIRNTLINGMLVDDFLFEDGKITGHVDPRLSITMTNLVIYLSEGNDPMNVLSLLREALDTIPKIVKDLQSIP